MKSKILLIEDDINLGYVLKEYIQLNGYNVTWTKTGKDSLLIANDNDFDLIILDISLPDIDGFEVAACLNQKVPLIFLTAKSLLVDKLKGFKLGADDYLTKPVEEEELIARIETVLKRRIPKTSINKFTSDAFTIGQYIFDFKNQSLIHASTKVTLTSKEAELLRMLCLSKNEILDRKHALKMLWGGVDYFNRRNMDVFISRLRKHLANDNSIKIINVHGKGFMLKDPS